MPSKRVPLKPPVKTTRSEPLPPGSAVNSRGRVGSDTRGLPLSRPARAHSDCAVGCSDAADATIDEAVEIQSVAHLPSFECLVSVSLMNRRGLRPGDWVCVRTASDVAFFEAVVGTQIVGACIGLSQVAAAALVEAHGTLHRMSACPPVGKAVVVQPLISANGGAAASRLTPQQVEASLRVLLNGHCVYVGMVLQRSVATHLLRFEVVRIVPELATASDSVSSSRSAPVPGDPYDGKAVLIWDATQIVVVEASSTPTQGEGEAAHVQTLFVDDATQHDAALPPRSLLIVGDSGTGKTFRLRQEVQHRMQSSSSSAAGLHVVTVDVAELLLRSSGSGGGGVTTATSLREVFQEARLLAPSLVVFDDLHLLCPAGKSLRAGSGWSATQLATTLADEIDSSPGGVSVIATTTSVDDLHAALLTHHRLGRHIVDVAPPSTPDERFSVLKSIFGVSEGTSSPEDVRLIRVLADVAQHSHGCTQKDLARLRQLAVSAALDRCGTPTLTPTDVAVAAKALRPSALKNLEVAVPNVTWNDIGGSDEAKAALQDCVEWCLGKNKWVFEQFGLSPPRGVLLYGPPGCSKTMLAKALANESRMNFISVKGPEVFSKWVGDSEKAVREIFRKARAVAPCVVFVDELDGMCGHRGSGGVSDRVISQFLTELDGLPAAMSAKSDSIILVAATNRPENIDPAVLRPGRIDRKVFVGLPDERERAAIAALTLRSMPVEKDVTAELIASRTSGYTGAEVVAVCKESAFHALEQSFSAETVQLADLNAALTKVRPRVSQRDVEWYKRWAGMSK